MISLFALFAGACMRQKTKVIIPPLAGLGQEFEQVAFDAGEGGVLTTEAGSVIKVPADAFIDSLGNHVTGSVQLRYRELHSAQDIFLSGIPMAVKSGSKAEVLQSAVMWEIRAFQDGKPLELDSVNHKTIKTSIASSVEGSDYDLWNLDEENGNWINLASVLPEPNPLRIKEDSLRQMTSATLSELDLSNCVVFNYYHALDVWEMPKDRIFNYYTYEGGTPKKAYTRRIKKRVEGFGINWVSAEGFYENVIYYGKHYPASMMVWDLNEMIPDHVRNNKDLIFESKNVGRHRYQFLFRNKDWDIVYRVSANIKMPLRTLYREGIENWLANKDSLMAAFEEQEKRFATLGSVMRTMEISNMGIYNYDKLFNKTGDLMVRASISLDNDEQLENDDLMVFVFLDKENTVIKYTQQEMNRFVIYPGADYQVFCVTGPNTMARLPRESLEEIIGDIPQLKGQDRPSVEFKMRAYEKEISTARGFKEFLADVDSYAYNGLSVSLRPSFRPHFSFFDAKFLYILLPEGASFI